MTRFFLGAAQEQFPPEDLVRQAVEAESAGFDGVSTSDHLQPWWQGGESGHTWPWLGAAGQATSTVPLGTGVTAVGARYHPILIAQAWMTLERLFPERPFLGIGSGEALNEVPLGLDWPPVDDQIARLDEALSIIRRLWDGETITESGRFYELRDARLHTLADRKPPIWVSAFGPKAARVAGRWGDGVWTLPDPESTPAVIEAFHSERGDEGGEIVFQAMFSWAEDDEAAFESVRKWKGAQPEEYYKEDWHSPRAMYEHGEEVVSDEELADQVIVGSDVDAHVEGIRELLELRPTVIVLQNNSPDPHRAIQVYGEEVLPALRSIHTAAPSR
jgi:coenzyme F420-dependent glucose-6-phosphate dehydrogenase